MSSSVAIRNEKRGALSSQQFSDSRQSSSRPNIPDLNHRMADGPLKAAGRRSQDDLDFRSQGARLLSSARIENQVGFRGPCRCHKSCVNLLGAKSIVKVIPIFTSLRQGRVVTTINGISMVEAHRDAVVKRT